MCPYWLFLSWAHTVCCSSYVGPYHLKPFLKPCPHYLKLLEDCQRVLFCLWPPPSPCLGSGCVCGMWFGPEPADYSVWKNKAPPVCNVFHIPGTWHQPAAGRTLPWPFEGAGCGCQDSITFGCVREEAPWPQQSGQRSQAGRGRPCHLWQQKPPEQYNQRDALHTTCCFVV